MFEIKTRAWQKPFVVLFSPKDGGDEDMGRKRRRKRVDKRGWMEEGRGKK